MVTLVVKCHKNCLKCRLSILETGKSRKVLLACNLLCDDEYVQIAYSIYKKKIHCHIIDEKTVHILYKAPREESREVHVLTMEIRQYLGVAS